MITQVGGTPVFSKAWFEADPENYRFHMSVSVPRSPALSTVDDMSAILGQLADGWLHHVGELIAIVATPDRLVACFDVTR